MTRKRKPTPKLPPELQGKEIWKPVTGWDFYEVSNCGRVRRWHKTLTKQPNGRFAWSWYRALINPMRDAHGLVAYLYQDGRRKKFLVKYLVAEEFLFPQGERVVSRNLGIWDCRITNLRCKSQRRDSYVSKGQVEYALREIEQGAYQVDIAKEFMVTKAALTIAIKRYKNERKDKV